ncbi:MAG TPA: lysophospholipid acyltransferase family protein [Kiritimatiellia bacterium]|nr:lysophospholipid acyltransferase family protein [Kiritimatiellia bacterium]
MIKFIAWFYAAVPLPVSLWFGRMIGRMLWVILPRKRKLAISSLASGFPDWTEEKCLAMTRQVFLNQGIFIAEMFRFFGHAKENPLDSIQFDPDDLVEARRLHAEGRGLLVLTGHLNNYEFLARWAARHFPMTIITKNISPPSLNDYLNDNRRSMGVDVLPPRNSYRAALRALKENRCVGFILDQNMKHRDGVFVSFFSRPACTTAGLAMLSAMSGAPVLPVFLLREGNGFKVRILPAIPPPASRETGALQDVTQLYSNAMETVIREQPESWIWIHNRWKTNPKPGDRITLPDGSVRHA